MGGLAHWQELNIHVTLGLGTAATANATMDTLHQRFAVILGYIFLGAQKET